MATTRHKKPPPRPAPRPHENVKLIAEGQRHCPICHQVMETARRSDDWIDVCAEHGVWLDRFELERMFMRRARRAGRRTRVVAREARIDGFFWGLLVP